MSLVLDLGCGTSKKPGSIGVDCCDIPGVDVVHHLGQFPYPFEDNSCDEIWMTDVIEHLPDTLKVMEEIWRILKPGACVHIKVVHWSHHHAYDDPTHIRWFSEKSWDFFTGKARSYYSKAQFELVKLDKIYDRTWRRFIPFESILSLLSGMFLNVMESTKVVLRKPLS